MNLHADILGKSYDVVFRRLRDLSAHCDPTTATITIDPRYSALQQRAAMIHEAIHAIEDQQGFRLAEDRVVDLEEGIDWLLSRNLWIPRLYTAQETAKPAGLWRAATK